MGLGFRVVKGCTKTHEGAAACWQTDSGTHNNATKSTRSLEPRKEPILGEQNPRSTSFAEYTSEQRKHAPSLDEKAHAAEALKPPLDLEKTLNRHPLARLVTPEALWGAVRPYSRACPWHRLGRKWLALRTSSSWWRSFWGAQDLGSLLRPWGVRPSGPSARQGATLIASLPETPNPKSPKPHVPSHPDRTSNPYRNQPRSYSSDAATAPHTSLAILFLKEQLP